MPAAPKKSAQTKPNILFIMSDDIGWFNISCNNNGIMGYATPNIDRIAKEGANFTDFTPEERVALLLARVGDLQEGGGVARGPGQGHPEVRDQHDHGHACVAPFAWRAALGPRWQLLLHSL